MNKQTERPRSERRSCVVAMAALLTGFLSACGPIISTSALHDAAEAVDKARTVNAQTLAIYEFTSAEAYLEKAREEWGYSDYQHAIEYARRALEFADRARYRATQGPGTPPTTGPVTP